MAFVNRLTSPLLKRLFARRPVATRKTPGLGLERLESREVFATGAGLLGAATPYNVFILGNASQSYTETTGRMAVGGDATLVGYGVGNALPGGGVDSLVVGRSLSYTNGQVFHGNVAYGTSGTISGVTLTDGTARQGTPVDFAAAASELKADAAGWAKFAPNGTVQNNYGTLVLTGTDAKFNVFSLSAAQLSGIYGLQINAPAGSTALVNVAGQSVSVQNFQTTLTGVDRQHVLFDLPDATTFTTSGLSFQGSVLAPYAAANVNNGNFEGTLVAASLTGSAEFHNFPTQAVVPPVSAPASLSGFVYFDANNDGVKLGSTETGIAGVTVTLTDSKGVSVTTTTNADGSYSFTGLTPGTFTVTETQPAAYLDGKDALGSAGGTLSNDKAGRRRTCLGHQRHRLQLRRTQAGSDHRHRLRRQQQQRRTRAERGRHPERRRDPVRDRRPGQDRRRDGQDRRERLLQLYGAAAGHLRRHRDSAGRLLRRQRTRRQHQRRQDD